MRAWREPQKRPSNLGELSDRELREFAVQHLAAIRNFTGVVAVLLLVGVIVGVLAAVA